jgi:hypothetical protein
MEGSIKNEEPKPTTISGSSGQEYQNIKVPDPVLGQTDKLVVPPAPGAPAKPVPQPTT